MAESRVMHRSPAQRGGVRMTRCTQAVAGLRSSPRTASEKIELHDSGRGARSAAGAVDRYRVAAAGTDLGACQPPVSMGACASPGRRHARLQRIMTWTLHPRRGTSVRISLRQRPRRRASSFLRAFDRSRAADRHVPSRACAAAGLRAGVLSGRTLTSWPGIRDDMVGAGATWLDQPVVTGWTPRSPAAACRISCRSSAGWIAHFAGRTARAESKATTSSPQRNEPPAAMLTAMKWLPRPSLRARPR